MRKFLQSILNAMEGGSPVEWVSVLSSAGSTPRGAGAMMAVFPGGKIAGTIGGGNVEFEAQRLAMELLQSGGDAVREFRFVQGDAASLGMVCGGNVTLQFQYLSPYAGGNVAVLCDLLEALERNADTWLLRRMQEEKVIGMGVADAAGARHLAEKPTDLPALLRNKATVKDGWFAVPMVRVGRVYIFGGGHVSRALVAAIEAVGFRAVVYDDRAEFANLAQFPGAEAAFCGEFTAILKQITITADDYVVVMTRGHQADFEVLTQTLRSGAKYLGCIGSRKKLALGRERLLEAGFTAEEIERIHAPIGLNIGAETPEEIAVSVAAELIAVRAGR